jgi:pyruvate/2-oxoglutarate dehydrogenase complex dihydrolipoamide acyltransferase (E2) component
MAHIPFDGTQNLTSYRKIAIASWNHPRDPSTYSWLDLPIEAAEAFLKEYKEKPRPTLTHYIAKIVTYCLLKHPELNHLLRAGNLYHRARTDAFITTLLKREGGYDLSGFTLHDVPHRSLAELAVLSEQAVQELRDDTDPTTKRTEAVVHALPAWLLRLVMGAQSFFQYTLNVSLRAFGIPDDRFGSVMISNFGVLGIENALVPLSPYCRCPLIMGIGRPRQIPVVRDGQVVAAECVTISFTFDHRYADGAHGAQMMRLFQKIFLNPHRYPHVFADGTEALAEKEEKAE